MWEVIEQCSTELVQCKGRFTRIAALNKQDQVDALSAQFNVSISL